MLFKDQRGIVNPVNAERDGFSDEAALQHAGKAGGRVGSHVAQITSARHKGGLKIENCAQWNERLCAFKAFAIVAAYPPLHLP
jgi:hypothetical protein